MKKTEYVFVYKSQLQRFIYIFLVVAGLLIGTWIGSFICAQVMFISEKIIGDLNLSNPGWQDWVIVVLCLMLLIASMFLGIFIGTYIAKRNVSTGILRLHDDYATLDYGNNKKLILKRDEFSVEEHMVSSRGRINQKYWKLTCVDVKKVRFYEAIISLRAPYFNLSLNKTFTKLQKSNLPALSQDTLRSLKKIKKRMNIVSSVNNGKTVKIGDVLISIGSSTPAVFDNTPYYVDYAGVKPKGVPLCICSVMELSDPGHIVGDIGFAADEDSEVVPPESILREKVIIEGIALDERIRID